MTKIKTAVFPVGGLGTRFLPATKSMPKEMLPVANKPIIQYAFEEARDAGIEKFIFITGRNKAAINNHFDHAYELESTLDEKNKSSELKQVMSWLPEAGQIAFVRQQKPLGLGHAVWCARNFIADNERFVVILADELIQNNNPQNNFLSKMIDFANQKEPGSNIIGVDKIAIKDSYKYGIIKVGKQNKILDMIEKPNPSEAPSDLAITGRYILSSQIFNYLQRTTIGKNGEIQLTDAMQKMNETHPFYYHQLDCPRFDCGNVLGYIEANIAFAVDNQEIGGKVKEILKKYS
jgi:UTP--glucose-1-phosphate uridylyltransferase